MVVGGVGFFFISVLVFFWKANPLTLKLKFFGLSKMTAMLMALLWRKERSFLCGTDLYAGCHVHLALMFSGGWRYSLPWNGSQANCREMTVNNHPP